jgi:phosphate/sulfate permease
MQSIYLIALIILIAFAVLDLMVGVANDAVNFLNSAIGSKAASRRVIYTVATIGILVGVMTSSGMMEVARNGVFHPGMFTFFDVMMLFLAVVLTDVIMLDIFNSLGLPTSTTVSLIFELLGSSVCIALFKISHDPALNVTNLAQYINGGKALGMISGILVSVVIAFVTGSFVMYVTRLLFSFNYTKKIKTAGALWCGFALTAITYFALFKGLKGTPVIPDSTFNFVEAHLWSSLGMLFIFWTILMYLLATLKVKILNIAVLAGTFALALAFAGNDLVNFIGVSVAGYDSYSTASAAVNAGMPAASVGSNLLMGSLAAPVKANPMMLLAAGIIMAVTIWTSKKARHVTDTEVNLARQDEGVEKFGSTSVSRAIVRLSMDINSAVKFALPAGLLRAINKRFQHPSDYQINSFSAESADSQRASFDILRASVNLTMSALLIVSATSLKLPLSTTYVTFMVAMGSSLADRAWGRESAVYRITGVLTVISGWFLTALIAFVVAFCVAEVLMLGKLVAVILLTLFACWLLYRSHYKKSKKENIALADAARDEKLSVVEKCSRGISDSISQIEFVYTQALDGAFKEDRRLLKEMLQKSASLYHSASDLKNNVVDTLIIFNKNNVETGHYYVQVVDYMDEVTKSIYQITKAAYDHINNNHEGLSAEQVADLQDMNDKLSIVFRKVSNMLSANNFDQIDEVISLGDNIFETQAEAIKHQIQRNKENQNTVRSSALYFNIIAEVKIIVLQLRNLLKAQKYFLSK